MTDLSNTPADAEAYEVRTCPVATGCADMHPRHGTEECPVDIGPWTGDPQDEEQCPCVGACESCHGYGLVEYGGREYLCRSCSGSGSAT